MDVEKPKYVSLDEVVKQYVESEEKKTLKEKLDPFLQFHKQVVDPNVGLFNHMPFVYPEWIPEMVISDQIITEDIPYEIVENKMLPPCQE